MKQYLDLAQVANSHIHKWGYNGFFILYVVFILMALYGYKRLNYHMKNAAASMVVIMAVMYFPPVVNFFASHYFSGHEFSRIGWGLLTVPLVAYGMVEIVFSRQDRGHKGVMFAAVIAVMLTLLLGGKSQGYFRIPDNLYKLPQESLEVEMLVEDATEEDDINIGITFRGSGQQSTTTLENIYYGLVAYGGGYNYSYVSGEQISSADYPVLIVDSSISLKELYKLGYIKVGETENTRVYVK